MTPQLFDALVIAVMLIGLALAGVRFYQDMTRPLPPERPNSAPSSSVNRTQTHAPQREDT